MSQKATEVQQSPMFSAISLADRKKIVSSAREKPLLPSDTVFLEGDPVPRISTNNKMSMSQVGYVWSAEKLSPGI